MKISPPEGRRWWLWLPIVIALALPLWQTQFQYGWLEMALGELAWIFWTVVAAWAVLTAAAVRRHRAWWLLVTAPLVLYPVVMALAVLASCARGDCL